MKSDIKIEVSGKDEKVKAWERSERVQLLKKSKR